jgi:TolB-like protein
LKAALASPPTTLDSRRTAIAVLAFANMSGDPEQEYFSDGLSEEIINSLSRVPDLKVIARTSAFAFKGQHLDVRKIAATLSVTHMLEGSVRKAGNRVRVTAQLQRWSPESAARARDSLQRAIVLDAGFAAAHCELGWCHFILACEHHLAADEAARLMSVSARAALDLDPALGDAHAVLAMAAVLGYEWEEAAREFQRAVSLGPVQAFVRCFYSVWCLAPLGRMSEALEQIRRSLEEDPLNIYARVMMSAELFTCGQRTEAEEAQRRVLDLDPNYWLAYTWRSTQRAVQGRLEEAYADAKRSYEAAPWNNVGVGVYAGLLALTGDHAAAEQLIGRFDEGSSPGVPCVHVAYRTLRSELDEAVAWYEKAIEQRDARAPWIIAALFGDRLTSHPRWPALRRMMKLPDLANGSCAALGKPTRARTVSNFGSAGK